MKFTDPHVIRWLGDNLEKGKRNYQGTRYPYAKIEQFDFWPTIDEDGDLTQPAEVRYIADGNTLLPNLNGTYKSYSWPARSNVFKYK